MTARILNAARRVARMTAASARRAWEPKTAGTLADLFALGGLVIEVAVLAPVAFAWLLVTGE
jgi:hypothetical protein